MKYIIVPKTILVDERLNSTEKIIMGIIYSLSLKNRECYASNSYFAKKLKVSNRTITSSISNLKNAGYIKVEQISNNRRIYVKTRWKFSSIGIEKNF